MLAKLFAPFALVAVASAQVPLPIDPYEVRSPDGSRTLFVDPSAWDPALVSHLWEELSPRADALAAAAPELPRVPPALP